MILEQQDHKVYRAIRDQLVQRGLLGDLKEIREPLVRQALLVPMVTQVQLGLQE